ncbi:protein of unknown function [Azospirillum baldaniorum]|uniref:Uncharacterized protein n=1 Tax=Azospirillum baldaniorum TaxID=1064539 RepID=A0A9P1JQA1_9PROT|nr:protein of unknown function [Azospirillum baldaniorum]
MADWMRHGRYRTETLDCIHGCVSLLPILYPNIYHLNVTCGFAPRHRSGTDGPPACFSKD